MARDGHGLPVMIAAAAPRMAIQVGVGFLRFQVRRKRGVRAFRGELLRGGMPNDSADRLAQAYHEVGSVRRLLRGVLAGSIPMMLPIGQLRNDGR